MTTDLASLLAAVRPVDGEAADAARERHDALAKPAGSFGRLEELAARLAAVAGTCPPPVPARPAVVVAAADHGVHAQGVTPWPQAITALVTATAAAGRATSSVLADAVGARMLVLDVGIATDLPPDVPVADHRIRAGTRDLTVEPAMTDAEVRAAIAVGAAGAQHAIDEGADLLVTGEVGIANTTASACLIAALTGSDPEKVTGRGSGIDDATLGRKREVVRRGLARHAADLPDATPLQTLASLGGLEHAALVGAMLAAAGSRVPVLLDGVITNAAACAAVAMQPHLAGHLVAGHRSAEPGGMVALDHLGIDGLLDLGLRLGEGTGALLAVPLVQMAARVLHDVATLDELTR